MRWFCFLCLFSTTAAAADVPVVVLTQAELQSIIDSAVAQSFDKQMHDKAKDAYDKVTKAFSPPQPAPKGVDHEP